MSWLDQHPEVRNVRCGAIDLNGQARGKRLPVRFARKIESEGTRFPLSVLNLDIWGEDVEDSPLVFEIGDPDGVLKPTERGYVPMPWLATPSALLPMWMFHEDGTTPYEGDPRQALRAVVDRFKGRGLTPVVATEMEFYLVDDSGTEIRQPPSPRSGKRRPGAEILSLRALDAFDSFFNELYDACDLMDIPAEAAISEVGLGQFEINLCHVPDALRAADDAWLFKQLVRGLARNHGFAASFMAKPYEDYAGNGLHTHFSVADAEGKNLFADGSFEGTPLLRQAIAGCLKGIPELVLIFAPHSNSYERLVPESHAPTGICWAYENRTASVRVPGGSLSARRVEHRVAGGDVNPYLFLAAVLGSALIGIEDGLEPPPPIMGNAYEQDLAQIPDTWEQAIDTFEESLIVRRIFHPQLIDNLVATKRQELHYMKELTPRQQLELYLDTV
jgi:glutamine synthetase